MGNDVIGILFKLIAEFTPYLFALCFHEYAHGWVAQKRGDNTAQMMGRLTMNPLAHADLLGTFVLPILAILNPGGIFFGWAKPVPVNERNLKNPRTDMFWIALAGPMSNIILAMISVVLVMISVRAFATTDYLQAIVIFFSKFIIVNISLAVFNSIPLHPLDGGKILARFLPPSINYKLEQNEHLTSIALLLIFLFPGARIILSYPVRVLYELFMGVATL